MKRDSRQNHRRHPITTPWINRLPSSIDAGLVLVLAAVTLWTIGCAVGQAPGPVTSPVATVSVHGLFLVDELREPSGICYHPGRATLFVVGDEGDIYELSLQCELLRAHHLIDEDCEGITCDPRSGDLYIVVEGADSILKVSSADFQILARHNVPRIHAGDTMLAQGGDGLEAIVYLPADVPTDTARFIVANQSMSVADGPDSSCLVELDISPVAGSSSEVVTVRRVLRPPIPDISALCRDPSDGCLYAVSDSSNSLSVVSEDGHIVRSWPLPGDDQEGIYISENGTIYIAQDSGGILMLRPTDAPDQ